MKRERLPLYLREVAQAFPDWFLDPVVLQTVRNNRIKVPENLTYYLGTMHVIERLMGGVDRVIDVLRTRHTQDDWDNALAELLTPAAPFPRTGFRLLPFPTPPFPDTPLLTALDTSEKFRNEKQKMRNKYCREYYIRQGLSYFYHWSEIEEATVELDRGHGCWTVYDVKTFDNRQPSADTEHKIFVALAERKVIGFDPNRWPGPSLPRPSVLLPPRPCRPFPPPPFPDTPVLTALTRARTLKSEGYKMQNCCFSYADDVRQGNSYFYHWSGGEAITVALKRRKRNKEIWRIFDLRKVGDRKPSTGTRQKIIAALADALGDRFTHFGMQIDHDTCRKKA